MAIGAGGAGSRRRARMFRITSDEWTPSASASLQAASTAARPSESAALRISTRGADPARAARHLLDAGLLEKGEGKNLQARLPRDVPGRPRAYAVRAEILGGDDD